MMTAVVVVMAVTVVMMGMVAAMMAGIVAVIVGMMVLTSMTMVMGVGIVMVLASQCAARTVATYGSPRGSPRKSGSARDATSGSGRVTA